MKMRVTGGPAEPFLSARGLFETEHDLSMPVHVEVRADPDERTRVSHDETHHLVISRQAATSAMARELALHEFAHMRHNERGHPSHTQSVEEALFLALTGRSVERRKVAHCYQIANHMKDIYADDLWVGLAPGGKLVGFFESTLAAAVADRPTDPPAWDAIHTKRSREQEADPPDRLTPAADPDITAVNAAFALALCERHDLIGTDHRLYDLAHAAARDAPDVELERFKQRFAALSADPDESEYRKALVDVTRQYVLGPRKAAD
ncbi:hypothetical protein GJ629_15105 [Halapricum sp. CBA1109]|uniref:DUF5781 family protein n=1 Tax=Halapricum sp. CBA1109 TaxID=2668068 RepID=UPI0012F8A8C4|nr:DUF5781 family protein [Halapricum sp. CBA1109]MUV91053.1 hypothetical protein [Halapricum sp. CBA1109]